jgi:hypothetical protein
MMKKRQKPSSKQDSRKRLRKAPSRLQDESKTVNDRRVLDGITEAYKSRLFVPGAIYKTDQTPQPPPDSFSNLLKEIQTLHDRKKADYTKKGDRFSNFRLAAHFSGIETFQSIENLIGVKQARLLELRDPGQETRPVNNEPIRDSLIDRAVYSILAVLYYDENQ